MAEAWRSLERPRRFSRFGVDRRDGRYELELFELSRVRYRNAAPISRHDAPKHPALQVLLADNEVDLTIRDPTGEAAANGAAAVALLKAHAAPSLSSFAASITSRCFSSNFSRACAS